MPFEPPRLPDLRDLIPPTRDFLKDIKSPGAELYADQVYERLETQIREAEDLAAERGLQLGLVYYVAPSEPIMVEDIGYHNTSLLILTGIDSANRWTRVLVHTASFQLVMKMFQPSTDGPKRRIGFSGEQGEQGPPPNAAT